MFTSRQTQSILDNVAVQEANDCFLLLSKRKIRVQNQA